MEATGSMTLGEVAGELEQRLRSIYEQGRPDALPVRAEATATALIVHYGRGGYRTRLSRPEALRFLDVTADAIQEVNAADA